MSEDKRRRKWEPNSEVKKIQWMMFRFWAVSMFIPIVLIVGINIMTYGPNSFDIFTKANYFNDQIYQLNELNVGEYLRKEVNDFTIEQPSVEDAIVFFEEIGKNLEGQENHGRFSNAFLLVRKNDDILMTRAFGDKLDRNDRVKFENLPQDILPEFKPGRETKNEVLFHQTGYVIASQQDFYFADGSQGSAFAFHKYTNIPSKIVSTIGKNLLLVVLGMFLFHLILAYIMTKRMTRPVAQIVLATEEVSEGNYDYQIPIGKQPIFSNISMSINKMIVELDKGKCYQDKIDSMRSEFIANVSHDMKTPLTSIKIHAQAIKDGIVNTPEKMDKYIGNILKKSDEMDSMLDELKIYNELEMGTGNYIMQNIDFALFLQDAIEELQYDVASENIELALELKVDALALEFDPMKIKRVLNNVVFNSVKYAEVRPLVIRVSLYEKKLNGKKSIKLLIEDNGVGVAEEEYDKLFKQHYRVDPARNQTISGSGLGLSIAESIVDHHGGSVYAKKSDLGGLAIVINLNCEVS